MADKLGVYDIYSDKQATIDVGKLTTREKIELVDGYGLVRSYENIPISAADEAKAVASGLMADAGLYSLFKTAATVVGGMTGGPTGAAAGFLASTVLSDINATIDVSTDNNEAFWSQFKSNISEIAREDNGFYEFLEGFNTGSSFIGMGSGEVLTEEWGDIIGRSGSRTAGSVLGTLSTYVSGYVLGGTNGMFGLGSLHQGMNEFYRERATGEEFWPAMANGTMLGVMLAATGIGSMKLFNAGARALGVSTINSTFGTVVHGLFSGADAAAWVEVDRAIESYIRDDLEYTYSPATSVIAFGLGAGASSLGPILSAAQKLRGKGKVSQELSKVPDDIINFPNSRPLSNSEYYDRAKSMVEAMQRDGFNGTLSTIDSVKDNGLRNKIMDDAFISDLNNNSMYSPENKRNVERVYSSVFPNMPKKKPVSSNVPKRKVTIPDSFEGRKISKNAKKMLEDYLSQADVNASVDDVLKKTTEKLRGRNDRIGVFELREYGL